MSDVKVKPCPSCDALVSVLEADEDGVCSVVKITKSVVCKTATREDAERVIRALERGADQ